MSIETLYQGVEESRKAIDETYTYLIKGQYDLNSPRSNIEGQTIEQLYRRATVVFETFLAIRPGDENTVGWSVLSAGEAEVLAAFANIQNQATAINNAIRLTGLDEFTIRDANNNFAFSFFVGEANAANVDVSAFFIQINTSLNRLLTMVSILLSLCKANSVVDLSERATSLREVVRETESIRNEARKLSKSAEQSANQSVVHQTAIEELLRQATLSLSKLQASQQQGNTDVGSVTALVEKIRTVGGNADSLEQQIDAYKSKFDAFQTLLDARNTDFAQFVTNTTTAEQANIKRDGEIDRLTKLADFMIRGATTAGLAKSMEDARERYENRMDGARKGFYFAVILLVVSAIPLVGHLLPGLFGSWFPVFDGKVDGSPYAAFGKIVLLLPATWLTAFFTKSYADFFHLEREYAHKAALAMSIDGFKRQAPTYEEEITAEVFMEIRTNPANRLGTEPASHPLYDVLSKVVGKVLEKKGEVKKDGA
ncbi:hypothetical protein [Collimonas fungivorans]|uniref:Uncharacterized protein n=1 Tax=Collimonas fungivorans (strain Ter331) TaxID=1005048 RepID=G0AIN9_COLFT|nr:hypothetical protein [Collimonas fungivorans]AEK60822.1 hypothetical protein CFU_0990 [Collimonas fungivorans Ter331]